MTYVDSVACGEYPLSPHCHRIWTWAERANRFPALLRELVAVHRVVLSVVVDVADAGGRFLANVAVQVADRLL